MNKETWSLEWPTRHITEKGSLDKSRDCRGIQLQCQDRKNTKGASTLAGLPSPLLTSLASLTACSARGQLRQEHL